MIKLLSAESAFAFELMALLLAELAQSWSELSA